MGTFGWCTVSFVAGIVFTCVVLRRFLVFLVVESIDELTNCKESPPDINENQSDIPPWGQPPDFWKDR